jgi:tRNA (guanine26-N2/guanine27-N2)-dimethyltransferase
MAAAADSSLAKASRRLLETLLRDPGLPARCWPTAELARRLGGGPPACGRLVEQLRVEGLAASVSGVMAGQFRSDAPWPRILEVAARVSSGPEASAAASGALDR